VTYTLRYTPEAADGLQEVIQAGLKRLAERILLKLAEDPHQGKLLTGKLSGIYSARITRRFRILYSVSEKEGVVVILDVGHRKDIYR